MRIEPAKFYCRTSNIVKKTAPKAVSSPIKNTGLMSCAAAAAIIAANSVKPIQKEITVSDIELKLKNMGFVKDEYDDLSIPKLSAEQENKINQKYGKSADSIKVKYKYAQLEKEDLTNFKKFIDIDKNIGQKLYNDNFENLTTIFLILKGNRQLKEFISLCDSNKDYFKLLSNIIETPLDKDTMNSISAWKGNSNIGIAKEATHALRYNIKNPSKDAEKFINDLSCYINKQNVPESIPLYRKEGLEVLKSVKTSNGENINLAKMMDNVANNPEEFDKFREFILDNEITTTQPCFMATSISKDLVKTFSGVEGPDKKPANVIWNFHVAPNTKGVYIEALNSSGSGFAEKEVLVQKNTQIKIQDVKYNKYKDIWEFDAQISN